MKKVVIALVLFVLALSFGCTDQGSMNRLEMKYRHEERMAQIAVSDKMSEQEKAQLADMIADRVVERLKNDQK
jgi:hypothetical protein